MRRSRVDLRPVLLEFGLIDALDWQTVGIGGGIKLQENNVCHFMEYWYR